MFKDHTFSDNLTNNAFNLPTSFMLSSYIKEKKKERKKEKFSGRLGTKRTKEQL